MLCENPSCFKMINFCKKFAYKTKLRRFCNQTCKNQYFYMLFIGRWKAGLESGMRGKTSISAHIRKYLFEKFNNKCQQCNWAEINVSTKKVPLDIEHIDGNFRNNQEDNLLLLCPNCHSLTSTYRSLNKGRGRPRK